MTRADRNNNPAAFTTDIAAQAGLTLNVDYVMGDIFWPDYHTAKLIGDPIAITIRVIDTIGYYTSRGVRRWDYIAIPTFIWHALNHDQKVAVVKFHYQHEGGTTLMPLFEAAHG